MGQRELDIEQKDVSLLPHQLEFVRDLDTRYISLVGGYGSGKTYAFIMKAIALAYANIGYQIALLEPTMGMVRRTLIPDFEITLTELGIPYKLIQHPEPKIILYLGSKPTTLWLHSAENYRRFVGVNLAAFGIDEIDTIENYDTAEACWNLMMSRLRRGNVYQGFATSTPEGFHWLYRWFEEEAEGKDDRRLIRARTMDNPYLPPEYVEDLYDKYTTEQAKAYLEGHFINLNTGIVYYKFDRKLNHTDKTLADYPRAPLHIGQDFNVGKNASIIHVIDGEHVLALDEIRGAKTTHDTIDIIRERYPNHPIIMYPDSSGKNESSNATTTDIALFQKAGFKCLYPSKNPRVKNRVGSVNAMFENSRGVRRYLVNTKVCKGFTKDLEQQSYDKTGRPEKRHDVDHATDACGYFIHLKFPIYERPVLRSS
jgi:hypothetical protein